MIESYFFKLNFNNYNYLKFKSIMEAILELKKNDNFKSQSIDQLNSIFKDV